MGKETTQQPLLPGMEAAITLDKNTKAAKELQELLDKYPKPDTKQRAVNFFRKFGRDQKLTYKIETTIKLEPDFDSIRVKLKCITASDIRVMNQQAAELPLDDQEEYDRLYLEIAQWAYHIWLELETKKYR